MASDRIKRWLVLAACAVQCTCAGAAGDAFDVRARLDAGSGGRMVLTVSFSVPAGHYLYADPIKVEGMGKSRLVPVTASKPEQKHDTHSDTVVSVFKHDTVFSYEVQDPETPVRIRVEYQGCNENMCFLPASREFSLTTSRSIETEAAGEAPPAGGESWRELAGHFEVAGRASGYLSAADFLAFLDRTDAGKGNAPARGRGLWASILIILLGGLALNLTPCVLPMIPINLAILGVGAQGQSRGRGFALGTVYGAGMALAYGVLGLAAVLGGTRFGTLNSSPWFNIVIALVFVVLGLAMFGVFNIDLSRFQGRADSTSARRGKLATALVMGIVAALLAGACVAPVVIWTLVLAADLYQRGFAFGLVLPFVLGIGMGLPWPVAGAGMSFLPKPGRWMEFVKYAFGVIILGFAVWYGLLGMSILRSRSADRKAEVATAQRAAAEQGGWTASLEDALAKAHQEGGEVFIDFWASWCKNCLAMDRTTFRDEAVIRRLEKYVRVKYQAEDLRDPGVKAVLDHFGVVGGLPTYVILRPSPVGKGAGP